MIKRRTIAVDFDGVLHGYSKGWHDGSIYDDPKAGAAKGMLTLQKLGFYVVVYSTRNLPRIVAGVQQAGMAKEVEQYLIKHGIPFDEVWDKPEKPLCVAFIDDNAIHFTSWDQALGDTMQHVFKYL